MEFNQNQRIALIALAILTIVTVGLLCYKHNKNNDNSGIQIVQPDGSDSEPELLLSEDTGLSSDQAGRSFPVIVHVAGEVNKPDVYKLPPGSRVIDAIRKAGGASGTADLDALNLAARVKDGEKILVPPRRMTIDVTFPALPKAAVQSGGQPPIQLPPFPSSTAAQSTSTGKLKNPGEGVVNINTADATELQRLPGVGPSTAQKILEFRSQVGRFSLPDQLMDVKGIGPKKFEKMKPFVCL